MTYTYKSPVGNLIIKDNGNAITKISFGQEEKENECPPSPLIMQAINQLNEYFDGKRKIFDFPISPQGTDFQKKYGNPFWRYPTEKQEVTKK